MRRWAQRAAAVASTLLAGVGVLCVAVRVPAGTGQKAAAAAAGFILPAGNFSGFKSIEEEDDTISSGPARSSSTAEVSLPSSSSGATSASSLPPVPFGKLPTASVTPKTTGKVLELSIGNSGTQVGSMWIKNSTDHHKSINFLQELQKPPAVQIQKGTTAPQVLIYHTHTTESYDNTERSTDRSRSVCAVGDCITQQLQAAGIGVVHDTTYHDYPAYDGSYDRSKATMQKDLKKYPSIRVTLDIHRDAMHRDDGTCLKSTVLVGGKKAAQMMILAGCDDDGTLGFPNWECNLRLALRLQNALSADYPGLARPLDFCARRYNEDMTKGSLLIEIGTDANTLDESKYTGSLLGQALAQVLNGS